MKRDVVMANHEKGRKQVAAYPIPTSLFLFIPEWVRCCIWENKDVGMGYATPWFLPFLWSAIPTSLDFSTCYKKCSQYYIAKKVVTWSLSQNARAHEDVGISNMASFHFHLRKVARFVLVMCGEKMKFAWCRCTPLKTVGKFCEKMKSTKVRNPRRSTRIYIHAEKRTHNCA